MDEILPVFKPTGISTYDLIRIFKKKAGFSGKIGHGGTLDPFASGVVLLLLGGATKKFEEIKRWDKTYIAGIRLGAESSTQDIEGKITFTENRAPAEKEVEAVLKMFAGKQNQKIPPFSAAKFKGRPLYELARSGEKIPLKTKAIEIKNIEILSYRYPLLVIKVVSSGGTYIRQLASDVGEKLGCGGFLYSLERIGVGEFGIQDCVMI